jgi:hypothetical protein
VSFKTNKEIDPYVSLLFAKNPDSLLRVMMESTQINKDTDLTHYTTADNSFLPRYKRSGKYDIVERGGTMRADGNETIFYK